MRALKVLLWVWRILLLIVWLGAVIGYSPAGGGVTWIVDAEVWLTNHVPDPILVAFLTGLLLSSWVVPAAWKFAKQHILHMETARTKLAHLRTAGVVIRNSIGEYEGTIRGPQWVKLATDWNTDVVSAIKAISEADAEFYKTLDIVPGPRLSLAMYDDISDEAMVHYHFHDFRLKKLEDLLNKYGNK